MMAVNLMVKQTNRIVKLIVKQTTRTIARDQRLRRRHVRNVGQILYHREMPYVTVIILLLLLL